VDLRTGFLRKQVIAPAAPEGSKIYTDRSMLMGDACAKAYGWSPKKG
jgi:hypothetical protein